MQDASEIIRQVRRLEITTSRNATESLSGNFRSAFRGQGIEIDDLRPYDEGDDLRHVDWVTSAKQGRLFVKRFRESRETAVMLIADMSASMDFGSGERSKKEAALEIAATLLLSAQKNSDRFGLVLAGPEPVLIPPRKGRSHLFLAFRSLISGYAAQERPPADYPAVLRLLNASVRHRGVCLLVGDRLPLEAERGLAALSRRHDLVFVRVSDPFERGLLPDGVMRLRDPQSGEEAAIDLSDPGLRKRFREAALVRLSKEAAVLRRNRIDCIDLEPSDKACDKLGAFFKERQKRN